MILLATQVQPISRLTRIGRLKAERKTFSFPSPRTTEQSRPGTPPAARTQKPLAFSFALPHRPSSSPHRPTPAAPSVCHGEERREENNLPFQRQQQQQHINPIALVVSIRRQPLQCHTQVSDNGTSFTNSPIGCADPSSRIQKTRQQSSHPLHPRRLAFPDNQRPPTHRRQPPLIQSVPALVSIQLRNSIVAPKWLVHQKQHDRNRQSIVARLK